MSDSDTESGTNEEQVDWAAAIAETISAGETTEETISADDEKDSTEEPLSAESTESTETDSEKEQDSETEPLEPLEQWSEDQKASFSELPRDAQQFLLARQSELQAGFTQKTQELADQRKQYEALDQVLKPYEEILARSGQSVAPVVAQALQMLASVSQDPAAAVKQAIQNYSLTPEQLGLAEEDVYTDPTIKSLRTQVENLERRLAQDKESQNQSRVQEGQAQIDNFKNATNDDGSPKYPHFDSLRTLMAPLVQSGKSLEEAYNSVVFTIPEYRESQSKAERERIEKEAKESQEKARADKARRARKSETLSQSDVDAAEVGNKKFTNWATATQETMAKLQQQE